MREVLVEGDARQRGTSHGEQLRERIHQTVAFYAEIFRMKQNTVFARAEQFRAAIRDYNDQYAEEIEGIAEAADIDPHWIFAINSRTELLSLTPAAGINECTALYFRPSSILGQTWDWEQRMQELIVLMSIRQPDGHTIRMIAEPGMIGKIGMNSAGIGTCLNLLRTGPLDVGVPVHIVLRAILDSRSIEEARNEVTRAGGGKASNILAGDGHGQCLNVEFAGERQYFHDPPLDVVTHTNHFLVEPGSDDPLMDLSSSLCRYKVASKLSESLTSFAVGDMTAILSDRSESDFPILRDYVDDDLIGQVGTVCTVIMELVAGTIHVRTGNDLEAEVVAYEVA
jgi:isopenicillin-N N-acyltransferase-like protein